MIASPVTCWLPLASPWITLATLFWVAVTAGVKFVDATLLTLFVSSEVPSLVIISESPIVVLLFLFRLTPALAPTVAPLSGRVLKILPEPDISPEAIKSFETLILVAPVPVSLPLLSILIVAFFIQPEV